MQAVMQPRIVKIAVPTVPGNATQSKPPARVAPRNNVVRRFLESLMLALAVPAV